MNKDRPTSAATVAATPREPGPGLPHLRTVCVAPWLLAIAAVVASRFRGQWDAYVALHRWCADRGIPDWARNFDALILFGAASFAGAWLAAQWCGKPATALLGLQRGRAGWAAMVLVALAPMVVGGAVLGAVRWNAESASTGLIAGLIGGVVRAPLAEELLFRGLLVGVVAAAIGWRGTRFWANAIAAALLFAVMHVPWTAQGLSDGWPTLLMTGAGGVWYAWLLSRWGSLWVPILLHAGMNLGWLLAGASGGAGGGGWIENLLRVATITIGTWWTVSRTPRPRDGA
ncbi:MAG: lysostaphin resistance A-like protein [Phycisphaerales bacterium]